MYEGMQAEPALAEKLLDKDFYNPPDDDFDDEDLS